MNLLEDLTCLKGEGLELLYGEPACTKGQPLNKSYFFKPGQIFSFKQKEKGRGDVLYVVRASCPGDDTSPVTGVSPHPVVLLVARGRLQVTRAKKYIEQILENRSFKDIREEELRVIDLKIRVRARRSPRVKRLKSSR